MNARTPWLTGVTVGAVLLVVSLALWFVFDTTFEQLYWLEIVGPQLEQRFGFKLEYVATPLPGRDQMYVITQVAPGGAFDRAGIQPGDTLTSWISYGSRVDYFFEALQSSEEQPIRMRVVNVSRGGEWPRYVREVAIIRPAV